MRKGIMLLWFISLSVNLYGQAPWNHGKLVVSENKRFIQHEDDIPSFTWVTPGGICLRTSAERM